MLLWQILGGTLGAAGVFALYLAWQKKERSWPIVIGAWALVAGGIWAFAQTSGVDKGPALGIVAFTVFAMIAIAIRAYTSPVKQRREIAPRVNATTRDASVWHEGLSVTLSILAIVFVGLIASVAACTALFMGNRALGMEHTGNLTLTMTSFPLLWAGLATYIGYASNRWGKAGVFALITTASAGIIAATM